jgi:hypothetical protein
MRGLIVQPKDLTIEDKNKGVSGLLLDLFAS